MNALTHEKIRSKAISWIMAGIVFSLNPPWFIWNYSYLIASIFIILLLILCIKRIISYPNLFSNNIIIFLVAFIFFILYGSVGEFRISSLLTLSTFFVLFFISKDEKVYSLNLITKILGLILSVSLPAWLINRFIIKLPMYGYLEYFEGKGDDAGDVLLNYILFIDYSNDTLIRFYSVFDEPGVLGTLAAFILFANKYNFKDKFNIILLISGLFTFSLAFVFITLIGLIIVNVKNKVKMFKMIVGILTFCSVIFILFKSDDTFKGVLLDRLFNIDNSGLESRTSYALNSFFRNFSNSEHIYFGLGTDFFSNNPTLLSGQGYKIFIIEYGIISLVILFFMYKSFIKKYNYLQYGCLLIFFVSFLQRPFLFTPWQLIIFALSIANFIDFNNIKLEKKINE